MSDVGLTSAPPSLPTFASLGVSPPEKFDPPAVARDWVGSFAGSIDNRDVQGLISTLHAEPWWRDIFALTWDIRTFQGRAKIETFLNDRLTETGFGSVAFVSAVYQPVAPDLAWILVHFSFETTVAAGNGIARLVYCADESWRAVTVSTHLDGLKAHPELTSADRDFRVIQGDWVERRKNELEFADTNPEVLMIGGGQAGLEIAARLKHLRVSHLIVEKNARIGDNWRTRYDSLTLHDPIWCNHMPYLHFPTSWPVFPSSKQVANWLEFYAEALELNIWLSSEAVSAVRNEATNKWDVVIRRGDGSSRTMHVDHIVLAQGFTFKKTVFPGQVGIEDFHGQIMHSSEFKSAKGLAGKKVAIIGACTSGHDIASDCADNGVDVTMVQRSSTYVMSIEKGILTNLPAAEWEGLSLEKGDSSRISMPFRFQKGLAQRGAAKIRDLDREMLEGLEKAGYRTNSGTDDTGVLYLLLERGGGYYFDDGSCQKIIDGKIKIKSGIEVDRITKTGVLFKDGSELPADIVVVATGFDDARVPIRKLVSEDVGVKIPPIWGLNEEGELKGPWRELEGLPKMWLMMGNFFWCRYFSKIIALQIKAKQEGLYGTRYAAPTS
ncbi:uncharacterized protein PHACADRAFT_82482 [Phanerochaete carnosa HHB-10118-sp]|uniref:FAD/NAD(P)-binding domain-containing protein n=1 Tax=Phanerochaete carnosa (strain HHB-10118-sp) TaxID=650164 RepID=K5WM17_PHACS|nr:uncharacterized protein PHACADRAFT_82482 [Phanerochaete carnosa HHB-10118-sp]EKM60234.1 hypothetical protein PHACADRAFT_82482 [Phanerochaete carnosa HHB-10118-sp]